MIWNELSEKSHPDVNQDIAIIIEDMAHAIYEDNDYFKTTIYWDPTQYIIAIPFAYEPQDIHLPRSLVTKKQSVHYAIGNVRKVIEENVDTHEVNEYFDIYLHDTNVFIITDKDENLKFCKWAAISPCSTESASIFNLQKHTGS